MCAVDDTQRFPNKSFKMNTFKNDRKYYYGNHIFFFF